MGKFWISCRCRRRRHHHRRWWSDIGAIIDSTVTFSRFSRIHFIISFVSFRGVTRRRRQCILLWPTKKILYISIKIKVLAESLDSQKNCSSTTKIVVAFHWWPIDGHVDINWFQSDSSGSGYRKHFLEYKKLLTDKFWLIDYYLWTRSW